MSDVKLAKEELQEEVSKTLAFLAETDKEQNGRVSDGTLEAFQVQGVQPPERSS